MQSIERYTVSIPDSQIQDLKQRLALTKLPDELADSGFDLGSPLTDIQSLIAYWKDEYDWRKAETTLNQLPHFTTNISLPGFESLNIHFIHKRSHVPGAIPLLFVHGWPGNFLEVTKIINDLAEGAPGHPAFDVVAPSLAGYGFSEGPRKKGFGLEQHARTYHELMQRLGYDQYVTQGGDWGHMITRAIGLLFPDHCRASHSNMPQGSKPTWRSNPISALQRSITPTSQRELDGLTRTRWFVNEGRGYFQEQSTKPQTLIYGLNDSPVALLAWIYEKLVAWTDSYPWTPDEVCTWVSIYWFSTAGPGASVRIYWEAQHPQPGMIPRERLFQWIGGVKIGSSHFPKELRPLPESWTHSQGPVVFTKTHERGGHFAAW